MLNGRNAVNGQKVDMFNLGHILFAMNFKSYPFGAATNEDRYYNCIMNQDPNAFWLHHLADGTPVD